MSTLFHSNFCLYFFSCISFLKAKPNEKSTMPQFLNDGEGGDLRGGGGQDRNLGVEGAGSPQKKRGREAKVPRWQTTLQVEGS